MLAGILSMMIGWWWNAQGHVSYHFWSVFSLANNAWDARSQNIYLRLWHWTVYARYPDSKLDNAGILRLFYNSLGMQGMLDICKGSPFRLKRVRIQQNIYQIPGPSTTLPE